MAVAYPPPRTRNCTGCGLCANVCSQHAIEMVWSKEGFLVPQVDSAICVNCGACVRACPAQPEQLAKLRSERSEEEKASAYGGWCKHKTHHLLSSSGGIFTALAEHVFSLGGCVFGVIWSNKDTAEYTRAENMEELAGMRGSKYTQAIPGMVYREVKTELKKGRQVLFCGTSCQVYALKRYLRKEYKNLLLADILCHGVPSRHLLQAYIREYEQRENKQVHHIQFRDKAGNWQQYHVRKHFADGSSISHMNWEDMFMRIFTADFVLNEACYNCPHARFPRVGDISLGDFWGGVQSAHPDWPVADGISSVLTNTSKGETVLQHLLVNGSITLQPVSIHELVKGQPFTYQRQAEPPKQRLRILSELQKYRLSAVYRRLFEQEQCGIFRFKRNGLLHRCYVKLRALKNKYFRRIDRQ